ncbi:MAG: hypothetical protein JWO47_410 [Candidatus Saccharibacteria bacterium]|nr:hypothetical protein [Candidatus Saccharibacteria bacterium]
MKKNEKGFSIVEVIMALVIIGLVVFIGLYVWHKKASKTTTTPLPSAQTTKTPPTSSVTPKAVDPYEGWQTVTNPDRAWTSIKVPASWQSKVCDGGAYIGLGSEKNKTGICSSDAVAQLGISYTNETTTKPVTKTDDLATFTDESVTVNGVSGHKYTMVEKSQPDAVMYADFTFIKYVFSTKNKTFTASYARSPEETDSSALIEQIVKSWVF